MTAKPDNTRERLVAAARELFHAQGYAATGIAQILKAAGANSGSLYHFFPTKEDLLLAVLEQYTQMLHPVLLDPIWSRIDDPIERIFGLLDGYRQMLCSTGFAYGCPIGNLALEVSDALPKARGLIAQNFIGWIEAVRSCLDAAADRLPAGLDRSQLASFILTVMEGGVMQAKAQRSLEPFDASVTQLRDYVDRLLADGTEWGHPADAPSARKQTQGMREPNRN